MTANMTDEEVIAGASLDVQFNTNSHCEVYLNGFRSAENIYLPQIQQLQWEYQTIKKMLESANDTNWEYRKEIETLTAKHERLVKGLKFIIPITNPSQDGEYYRQSDIEGLLTESEDKDAVE